MRKATRDARPAGNVPDVILASSVVPAIDELVAGFAGRGIVAATEVVDVLLDLRLIAVADEVVGTLV